jgi:hypothetical protein
VHVTRLVEDLTVEERLETVDTGETVYDGPEGGDYGAVGR